MRQTDYVILGLLSESPLTGYEMKNIIDVRFRFFWSESYGQLYPALKSLSSEGFIKELIMDKETKRAQRRYEITSVGMDALKQWLTLPVEKESLRLEILLKMYFSNLVDEEVMMQHIRIFQQSHKQDLMILNMFEKELKAILDQDPNHGHVLKVVDFGKKVNEAYLNWSQETLLFFEERIRK
jgi:DNA-binding PadR family transcriptional regulator